METKLVAVVKLESLDLTAYMAGLPTRRSRRKTGEPKRLQYSPTPVNTASRKKKTQKDVKEESDAESDDEEPEAAEYDGKLSLYELKRLENIREKQMFLCSLNIFEAAQELKQSTKQRGLKRPQAVKEVLPARKSLRLQNKEAETSMASFWIS